MVAFDGTSDVFEYCGIIDNLLTQCQENQIPTFLFLVKSKLFGNARTVIVGEEINTWNALRTLLIQNFNDEKTDSICQNEFLNCRQKPTESVQSFADRVRKCTKAMVMQSNDNQRGTGRVLLHNQARIVFIDGLKPQIKEIFRFRTTETLEDAVILAKQEEQILNNSNNNSELKNICSYCNQTGHFANNCVDLILLSTIKKFDNLKLNDSKVAPLNNCTNDSTLVNNNNNDNNNNNNKNNSRRNSEPSRNSQWSNPGNNTSFNDNNGYTEKNNSHFSTKNVVNIINLWLFWYQPQT